MGPRRQRAVALDLPAGRRRGRAGRVCPRRARDVPDAADRACVPRTGVDAGGAAARRHAARLVGRPGRVGRPQPDRVGARHRTRPDRRGVGVERRCVRRQGRHEQPGADRARGVAVAATGEVHAVARGEPVPAPEAPSDPDGVPGRLRRRGQADRAALPHGRRLGRVRVGRHEGARARGRARERAVPRARDRRGGRSRRVRTTRSAARSADSARTRPSSRWKAFSTGSPMRSVSAVGRSGRAT